MILCNFNINNLFVRYKFGRSIPGDCSGKSAVEDENFGYLPLYQKGSFEIFNDAQRKLAACALTRGGTVFPDIICLQEVESMIALRIFNDQFLDSRYKHALVIDSRDPRQIDVGILSKYPITGIRSNMDEKNEKNYIFSRDCLEVTLQPNKGVSLTLFINHFKSKLVRGKNEIERKKNRDQSNSKRRLQADTVTRIVKERFPENRFDTQYFAVLGDFNDTPMAPELTSLVNQSGLIDIFSEGKITSENRWTHYYKTDNSVSQLDHILISPALANKLKKIEIERRGIGFRGLSKKDNSTMLPRAVKLKKFDNDSNPAIVDFQFERFKDVSAENVASDHCPIFVTLDID